MNFLPSEMSVARRRHRNRAQSTPMSPLGCRPRVLSITQMLWVLHETIWTILFVSILGFGMLPGVLALTLFSAGFAAKLFAEEIEAIDMGPVEAMRRALEAVRAR